MKFLLQWLAATLVPLYVVFTGRLDFPEWINRRLK